MPSQSDFDSDKQLVSDLQRILHSCINGLHATIATLKKTVLSSEQHQAIDKLEYDTDHLHSIMPLLVNTLNGNDALDNAHASPQHDRNKSGTDNNLLMQAEDELAITQEIFGDGFAELAQLFLEDSPPRLIALKNAAAAADCTALARGAHTLCGSTSSIGATTLADLCRELETRARNKVTDGASARIDAIENEYARIKTKLLLMV